MELDLKNQVWFNTNHSFHTRLHVITNLEYIKVELRHVNSSIKCVNVTRN